MTQTIQPEMTMEEILREYPAAQRALFQRYHVGGCSECGFQPTDTLAQVCKDHNILDVKEVVQHILRSQEIDERMLIDAGDVKRRVDAGEELLLLDVRPPEELAQAPLSGAEPLDFANQQKYMELPKHHPIVFVCKDGGRSKDVAAYFIGHGFSDVHAVRDGLEGWRRAVDPSLPVY